jgi:hypothetical protein
VLGRAHAESAHQGERDHHNPQQHATLFGQRYPSRCSSAASGGRLPGAPASVRGSGKETPSRLDHGTSPVLPKTQISPTKRQGPTLP